MEVSTPPPQEVELTLDKPEEILRLLRRLGQKGNMFTVHAPGGAPLFLSTLVDIDECSGRMLIDAAHDPEATGKALLYPQVRCIGQVDSVGLRFSLSALEPVEHAGMTALSAALPTELLYLQRRDYYRLRLPGYRQGQCRIPLVGTPADPLQRPLDHVDLRIVDISAGGVALRVPPEYADSCPAGTGLGRCTLLLDDVEPLPVEMVVRHLAERRYEEGPGVWQAGCEFIDPRPLVQRRIQRFIMEIERELAARARGAR